MLNRKVAKVTGAVKDAPIQTEFNPVLSALPEANTMVAGSSISIMPVAVATAQPAAGG